MAVKAIPFFVMKLAALILLLAAGLAVRSGDAQSQSAVATPAQASVAAASKELGKRAEAARQSGRGAEAIALYRQGLALDSGWEEGWWQLGTLLYEAASYDEARTAFARLVGLQPAGGPAWALLGLSQFQIGQQKEALESLQKARVLGTGSNRQLTSLADYHAAVLMVRFGQFEKAMPILLALAKESSGHPRLLVPLGLSLLALPLLPGDALPEQTQLATEVGKAAYLTTLLRLDEAGQTYRQLIERYPQQPNVHYNYGLFLLLLRDADGALRQFQKVVQLWPSHVSARLQIVFEYVRRSDYKAALPVAEQAIELAPHSAEAHSNLGLVLVELGEADASIRHLKKAAELAPADHQVRFWLARAYSRAGRKEDAERELNEFRRLRGEKP